MLWLSSPEVSLVFEMHAAGISAYVNPELNGKAVIHNRSGVTEISTVEIASSDQNHIVYGFYAENRHFIDCIQQDQLPETHFSDAVKTMELVDMIYQNRIDE